MEKKEESGASYEQKLSVDKLEKTRFAEVERERFFITKTQ
ncbi:hypothetical protein T11_12952 [Trichinella zimbabwensis]|uniref:Uncharacterized protein n=1 Tax=Trichinella zimbabwensis TaxID=268475 RepID=A0A0V1G9H9_9BILA|nr:hypothetical protein T11_12952 [Trichinella zimbabwensis]